MTECHSRIHAPSNRRRAQPRLLHHRSAPRPRSPLPGPPTPGSRTRPAAPWRPTPCAATTAGSPRSPRHPIRHTAGAVPSKPQRILYDCETGTTLPGVKVREEGDKPTSDASVNRAYAGLGATFELLLSAYGRSSIDGRGLPLIGSVHYGREYNNAFFDGEQMVFGDGDGEIFLDFTVAVDVIAHELAHGLTRYTANLRYEGQSGALNESVSDVIGSLVKQYSLGQSAEQADWLIGAGLLAPGSAETRCAR
ncbi:hypothetical protein SBADM41S_04769 [Streptomyces badius]